MSYLQDRHDHCMERSMDMNLTPLEVMENQDELVEIEDEESIFESQCKEKLADLEASMESDLDDLAADRDAAELRATEMYNRLSDAISEHVKDPELAGKLHEAIDYVD